MGLRAAKIDTLSLAKELENAGIPRLQAEAQIQTTIKVINMTIEEQLVTKHDLTHALHRTEEKLFAKFTKLEEADEKLSEKIDKVEERLSLRIGKVEEKLSLRIDKLDEKFSCETTEIKKDFQEMKNMQATFASDLKQLSSTLTFRICGILGSIIGLGFASLALLSRLH